MRAHLLKTITDGATAYQGASVRIIDPATGNNYTGNLYVDDSATPAQLTNPFTSPNGVLDIYFDNPIRLNLGITVGTAAEFIIAGVDAILPQDPLVAHHASHEIGGSDALTSFAPVGSGGGGGGGGSFVLGDTYVNIKEHYNLRGDGTAEDPTGIRQFLLDYASGGATGFLPPGVYNFQPGSGTDVILPFTGNQRILGAGRPGSGAINVGTVIKASGACKAIVETAANSHANGLRALGIDGANVVQYCVHAQGDETSIEDVTLFHATQWCLGSEVGADKVTVTNVLLNPNNAGAGAIQSQGYWMVEALRTINQRAANQWGFANKVTASRFFGGDAYGNQVNGVSNSFSACTFDTAVNALLYLTGNADNTMIAACDFNQSGSNTANAAIYNDTGKGMLVTSCVATIATGVTRWNYFASFSQQAAADRTTIFGVNAPGVSNGSDKACHYAMIRANGTWNV